MIVAKPQSYNPYARRKNATCDCRIATASSQSTEAKHIHMQLKNQGYRYIKPKGFRLAQAEGKPVFTRAFYLRETENENAIYGDFKIFHPEKHPWGLFIDHAIHFHYNEFNVIPEDKRDYDEYCKAKAGFDQYEADHDEMSINAWFSLIGDYYHSPTILVPENGYCKQLLQEIVSRPFEDDEPPLSSVQHIFSMPEFTEWATSGGI